MAARPPPRPTASLLDEPLAIVDLETTGTNANWDRITEVGIISITDGVVEEWSTLVDPECRLPPAIESLTGITSDMVRGAPTFAMLADEIEYRLAGRLFVAHNARFDHAFLKAGFARLGRRFAPRVLCTARLSRRLFPAFQRHNLDALIGRHGLDCAARHRALGDARVLVAFLARVRGEVEPAALEAALTHQLQRPTLPAHLDAQAVESLPDTPGVYLMYGEDDAVLYVGKSVRVRSRVKGHFAADSREPKELRLAREVRRIEVVPSVGELGALLRESHLVKELAPVYNRRLRRSRALHSLRWMPDLAAPTAPEVVALAATDAPDARELFGVFRTRREAERALVALADEQGLCRKVLGLESGTGPCFARQIKRCKGACEGAESPAQHALRLHGALARLRLRTWPFPGRIGLRERAPDGLSEELHVFDHWRWVGSATDPGAAAALWDAAPGTFDLDTYRILVRELDRPGRFTFVPPP